MIDPDEFVAPEADGPGFEDDDAFRDRVRRDARHDLDVFDDGSPGHQLLLLPPVEPLRLSAYLASALTGLTDDQRQLIFHLSDTISEVCSRFGVDVYEPRKASDPVHHSDIPASTVWKMDRDRVLSSDLLIHLAHFPSTGAGEELDFAYNALIPIILISHSDSKISRMITGIPGFKLDIRYSQPEELRGQLEESLVAIRPILDERRLAFAGSDNNIVGEKIRALRQELGITREEIQSLCPFLDIDLLQRIEESSDRLSDPSLSQLRVIATILNTTVADLVEPDLGQRVVASLHEWITTNKAARFGGMTERDSNRVLRRMLLRVIDALEEDLDADQGDGESVSG